VNHQDDPRAAWDRLPAELQRVGEREPYYPILTGDLISPEWRTPPGAQHINLPPSYVGTAFPQFADYDIHLAGFPIAEAEPPYPWPAYSEFRNRGDKPHFVMQLWYRRVQYLASPLFVEAYWHPNLGEEILIRGLEQPHRKPDVDRAWQGMRLIRVLGRGGRPPGSGVLSEDEFLEQHSKAVAKLKKEHKRLTQGRIAAELWMDPSTLATYYERYPEARRPS
jgi:hypothetical protein